MILFSLIIFSLVGYVLSCPPEGSIAPFCECKYMFGDYMMFCRHFENPDQVVGPIRALAMSGKFVFSLSIENSSLVYIPSSIFKDTTFRKILFLSTQVMSLSDTDVAFEGLENSLEELRATDAQYVAQWDWKQLKNMKVLHLIDVNNIVMGSIDEPLPKLPELRFLGIILAEISFIVDHAFASLEELTVLNMKGNDISSLKRNYLPNPATRLTILDFSDNNLSNLPEDFFTKMPNLADVRLEKNNFVTLSEKTFSWPVQHLQDLVLYDNPLRCDCRLRWLVGIRTPFNFLATCSSPESLSGLSLRKLDLKSLWC